MQLAEAVRQHFEVAQEIGDEFLVCCPSPDHDDSNPSASINVKKGLWTCYACGAGGRAVDLFTDVHITTEPDTEELLLDMARNVERCQRTLWKEWDGLPESTLKRYVNNEATAYWEGRGVPLEAIRDFQLGYDIMRDAATIPIRGESGALLGVIRRYRNPRPPEVPKYEYPEGVDISRCLFNYENAESRLPIWVAEGAIDAVIADARSDEMTAVAQYGLFLHDAQIEMLKRKDPACIVLAYDMDPQGQESVRRAAFGYTDRKGREHPPLAFGSFFVLAARWDPKYGKDLAEVAQNDHWSKIDIYNPLTEWVEPQV